MQKGLIKKIAEKYNTPIYVYSEEILEKNAKNILNFPNAYSLTARYAMKALPTKRILQIFNELGLHIDASSFYEVERAINAGINPKNIQLTSQELPEEKIKYLIEIGVIINACSLRQLEDIGKNSQGINISIRINPGIGSGNTQKVNVGGSLSSFGIWHGQFEEIKNIINKYNLKITKLHTHIGSGNNPEIWKKVAQISLELVKKFENVTTLNLGGGFKVDRMNPQNNTNIEECGNVIEELFVKFNEETGRKLKLEIEPGTYLVANAGFIISKIIDIVKTDKFEFIKTDTGMTEITRPTLYAAQHPITIIPQDETQRKEKEYIFVGHCCESGDLLTPEENNPEIPKPRKITEANIGDLILIGGAGAYCSGMSTKNYNSFPEAPEVLITKNNEIELIRQKQELNQMIQNEK